jgi:hypothetical protein
MKIMIVLASVIGMTWQMLPAQNAPDFLQKESAPGARAAMGLFSHASSKALLNELFLVKRYSWEESLGSVALAATSYQILSYHTTGGLELKPFKLNKEWKGYWEGYLAGEALDWFLYGVESSKAAQLVIASVLGATMLTVLVSGETHKGFRKAQDGPLTLKSLFTNRDSYWIHFAGSGGLYWAISNHSESPERSLLYTSMLVWLWEVKDGYIWWEDVGFLGGDGFSWRDGTAGTVAAAGSYAFDKWLLPWIRSNVFTNVSMKMMACGDGIQVGVRFRY